MVTFVVTVEEKSPKLGKSLVRPRHKHGLDRGQPSKTRKLSRFRSAHWILVCIALLPRPLGAQWLPPLTPPEHPARFGDSTYHAVPAADLAFLGTLGGAVGCLPGLLGGRAAYGLFHGSGGGDLDGLAYAFYGCLAGVAIGLPTAVHLANHRRGSFWLDLLASAGIGAIGLGIGAALDPPASTAWLIPVAMVGLTVAAEKHVEHRVTPRAGRLPLTGARLPLRARAW